MSDCDEFQAAIEKRAHHALEAHIVPQLMAHLAACDACRRFEVTVHETEAMMRASGNEVLTGMNWEQIRSRIEQQVRDYQRSMRWLPLAPFLVAFAIWLPKALSGRAVDWEQIILLALLMTAVGPLAATLRARRAIRELETAEKTPGGALESYRRDVDRRIAGARIARVVVPLAGLALALLPVALPSARSSTEFLLSQIAFGLLAVGFGGYFHLMVRRLGRERAELW